VGSRFFLAAALLVAGLSAAGCGSVAASNEEGSSFAGKPLFVQQCGSCHTLADAGTKGTIGPNLDEAFGNVKKQGYDESTIRDVVRGQIAYPTSEPPTGDPGMPANLVTGDDAWDVATYVAAVAGVPVQGGGGGQAAPSDPKQVFVQSCGGCHTLQDAGTSGTIGPNLDQLKPPLDAAVRQITNGGGGMPAFGDQLSEQQIQALAEYVVKATGGG
jgi:cbb3-type cytochrome c oxidase subunit III